MEALLTGWLGKLLLGPAMAVVTALLKTVIDKYTPIALAKIPKLMWPTLLLVMSNAATNISPDAFLLPGFPSWASTMLYPLLSMGVYEVYDQARKAAASGEVSPTDKQSTTGMKVGI